MKKNYNSKQRKIYSDYSEYSTEKFEEAINSQKYVSGVLEIIQNILDERKKNLINSVLPPKNGNHENTEKNYEKPEKQSPENNVKQESTKKSNGETNSNNEKGKSNSNGFKINITGFIINSLRNGFILAIALLIIFIVFKGWSISEVLSKMINNGEGLLVLIVLGAAYEIFKIFKL